MRGFSARSSSGFTFLELLVVTAIIMVLAMGALPMVRVSIRRQRETDYRYTLKTVRAAIDKFKDNCDAGRLAQTEMVYGADCYPTSLEQLVEGALIANDSTGKRMKFLRKIPIDPITGNTEWGKRSFADAPDAKVWGGQSVYDIYTKSEGKALNGTKYRDW
jgi:general secretion pathway protein G